MQLDQDMVVSKWCSLSPDKDSSESKTFKVELLVPKGTTVNDLAQAVLSTTVIKFQNARRPKYDKLVDKSTHKVTFKRPITEVDPEDAMVALLQAMTPEEQADKIQELMDKITQ